MFYQKFLDFTYDQFQSGSMDFDYANKSKMINFFRKHLDRRSERFLLQDMVVMALNLAAIERVNLYTSTVYNLTYNDSVLGEPKVESLEVLLLLWPILQRLTVTTQTSELFSYFADSFDRLEKVLIDCPRLNASGVAKSLDDINKQIDAAIEKVGREKAQLFTDEKYHHFERCASCGRTGLVNA